MAGDLVVTTLSDVIDMYIMDGVCYVLKIKAKAQQVIW